MQPDITKGFQYQAPKIPQLGSLTGGATKPGQVNAQNMKPQMTTNPFSPLAPIGPYVPPVSSTKPKTVAQPTQTSNPYGQLGSQANLDTLLKALNYTPNSVDMNIDGNIPSDALKGTPSPTTTSQKAEKLKSQVLDSRFSKEEAELIKSISNLRTGIAGLEGTQAKEYANLEDNPEGVFGPNVLSSQLNRLSKDQAIELSARTGQLNAYLDNLEMYQGYRPTMVGTPQIDKVTGEAFAYIQDPMTGELTTQSLGQIMTPEPVNPYENYMAVGEGTTIFDPETGEAIYTAPKTYKPESGTGGGGGGGYGSLAGVGPAGNYAFDNATDIISFANTALNAVEEGGDTGLTSLVTRFGTGKTGVANNAIKSLKALIGFGQLNEMRQASPTGGALGQVSEKEIDFLQAVQGELGLYQNKEQWKSTIQRIKESSLRVRASIKLYNNFALSPEEQSALERAVNDLTGSGTTGGGFQEGDFK